VAMARKGTGPAAVLANRAQQTRIMTNDYSAEPPAAATHPNRRPGLLPAPAAALVVVNDRRRHLDPLEAASDQPPGVADLRAGYAAAGRLEMRLHLARINEPIKGPKRPAGAPPRGISHFKNEPEKCCRINKSTQKRT
jgi:hypothetical protein